MWVPAKRNWWRGTETEIQEPKTPNIWNNEVRSRGLASVGWDVYLRDEQQTQRDGDGQVCVGEEEQQHPVWVELLDQREPVRRKQPRSHWKLTC